MNYFLNLVKNYKDMVIESGTPPEEVAALPRTLAEFQLWEPNDGYKYEWNDGKIIQFEGFGKKKLYIFANLNNFFIKKNYWKLRVFISVFDTKLSDFQLRRPDIAYLSKKQIQQTKKGEDEIPEFVIEIISGNDNINLVEKKIVEYYKAGVSVVWLILPEEQTVHVYTSRKKVQICTDDDICSAKPVLPDFEISVNDIFA